MGRFDDILQRVPINKMAAIVTSQTNVSLLDIGLTEADANYILDRLKRKHQLLKHVLGVSTRAQHKNLCHAHNSGWQQFRAEKEPKAFIEYRIIGRQIEIMQQIQRRFKADRKLGGTMIHNWMMDSLHTVVMPKRIKKERGLWRSHPAALPPEHPQAK